MFFTYEPFYSGLFEDLRSAGLFENNFKKVSQLITNSFLELRKTVNAYMLGVLMFEVKNSNKNQKIIDLYNNLLCKLDANLSSNIHKYHAVFNGDVELVEFFLKNTRSLDQEWNLSLLVDCLFYSRDSICNRREVLNLFIRYGLATTYNNKFDHNLLHRLVLIVKRDDHEAVEFAEILLNSGISVHERDIETFSPLDYSILKQNISLISLFLIKGANINQCSREGPPLHLAAKFCDDNIIKYLISKGADVNGKDDNNDTALHEACQRCNYEIISLLIRSGADISPQGIRKDTPFSIILDPEDPEYYDWDIDYSKDQYNKCVFYMIKEFAKLLYKNISVSKEDMHLVGKIAPYRFDGCTTELIEMNSVNFFGSHSFYSLLNKSISVTKLASLTNNENIARKFYSYKETLNFYQDDLQLIWEEAVCFREKFQNVTSTLNSIFNNFLPDVVVRKLAKCLIQEDL